MTRQTKNTLTMRAMKLLHVLVVTGLFMACAYWYYIPALGIGKAMQYLVAGGMIYVAMHVLLARVYRAYMVGTSRIRQLVFSQGLTHVLAAAIGYLAVSVFKLHFANPLPLMGLVAVQLLWDMLWSFLANRIYYNVNKGRKAAVIYTTEEDLQTVESLEHLERKFQLAHFVKLPEEADRMEAVLADTEAMFVMIADMDIRNTLIKRCMSKGIACYFPPRIGDVLVSGADHMQSFSVPMLRVQGARMPIEYLIIKRAFDILVSLVAIVVASPFMLATAIAIKAYDRGPVLYKQVRLTKGRKEFKVLKFRSMRVDAEKDGVARLSTENDDRITPVGKIIRKIRFDELPQLFNILRGDMSIVGPRPERPEIAAQYEKEIPSFGLRLQVKGGLTGYAQVYGRYNTTPYDKLKMDLMYINRMSVVEDVRIMLATVKVLFMKESTEGVKQGQTTASHKENDKEKELQNV